MSDARKPLRAAAPACVRLLAPYGYVQDGGEPAFWMAGQVVTDAAQIADLCERLAPIEPCDPPVEAAGDVFAPPPAWIGV